jgi:hypothetical protein
MINRRRRRAVPGQPAEALIRIENPDDIPADSPHGRLLRAPALSRRLPTVAELAWLSDLGYDVITGPTRIHAVETAEGTRYENLHKVGWPEGCDCRTSVCSGEADR